MEEVGDVEAVINRDLGGQMEFCHFNHGWIYLGPELVGYMDAFFYLLRFSVSQILSNDINLWDGGGHSGTEAFTPRGWCLFLCYMGL